MDRVHQRFHRGFGLHGQYPFADQLKGLRPDDMHPKNFAVLFVGHDLHESIVLSENRSLAIRREWKLPDLYLVLYKVYALFLEVVLVPRV